MKQAATRLAIMLVMCAPIAFAQTPTLQFPPAVLQKKASILAVKMDPGAIVKVDGVIVPETSILEKKDKPRVVRFELSGYPPIERQVEPGNHYVICIGVTLIVSGASVFEFDQPPDQLDSGMLASIVALNAASSTAAESAKPNANVAAKATPFGFEAGMTKEQVIAKLGKDSLVQDNGVLVTFKSAPDPHPDFALYQCGFSPEQGLLKVSAFSRNIETNEYGNELQAQFRAVRDALAQKYGKPATDIDQCGGTVIDCNGKFFMSSLKNDIRTLDSFWKTNLPMNLESLTLESNALDENNGYVAVSYEFQGWSKFVEKVNQKSNSPF